MGVEVTIDQESQAVGRWTPAECLVAQETEQAVKTARDLAFSLKRLARLMRNCQSCLAAGPGEAQYNCPVLMQINAQIEMAILDLNREWGMLP